MYCDRVPFSLNSVIGCYQHIYHIYKRSIKSNALKVFDKCPHLPVELISYFVQTSDHRTGAVVNIAQSNSIWIFMKGQSR